MSVPFSGAFGADVAGGGATGDERSVRLRASASAYFSRTFAGASSATWTFSCWVKKSTNSGPGSYIILLDGSSGTNSYIGFGGSALSDKLIFLGAANAATTAVFRDNSSFYHVMFVSPSVGANIKIYVNGVEQTMASNAVGVALSATMNIGRAKYVGEYFDGYFADFCFVDGTAYTPSQFGETNANGIWVPKTPADIISSTTFGNNGFFLDFRDIATTAGSNAGLGKDTSGKGNYWTTNNISVTAGVTYDSMYDYPLNSASDTQPVGNYATLNPIVASAANISRGALTSGTTAVQATIDAGIVTGGAYWEVAAGASAVTAGVINESGTTNTTTVTANKVFGFRLTSGDALDYINITDAGAWTSITTGLTGVRFPYGVTQAADWNFGQRPFIGTASGSALCTANLPTPAIENPAEYFDVKTRTGTGASYSVTGLGFSPDLVVAKSRSAATDWSVYDAVRGAQAQVEFNTSSDETTEATGLTAFNADGYSGGALAQINTNAATYFDTFWNASVTAGMDIVTYTGNGANRTINHSLGAVPKFMLVKARTTSGADVKFAAYHANLTSAAYYIEMAAAAETSDATAWNSTAPTSSVFSVGTSAYTNTNNDAYVAYLFAEVAGFSAFGKYTGNGSTDGPFVHCGFSPKLVIIKNSAVGNHWYWHDTVRDTSNLTDIQIAPSTSTAEGVSSFYTTGIDIVSNGFKVRSSDGGVNTNASATYLYLAFAEFPFASNNRAR